MVRVDLSPGRRWVERRGVTIRIRFPDGKAGNRGYPIITEPAEIIKGIFKIDPSSPRSNHDLLCHSSRLSFTPNQVNGMMTYKELTDEVDHKQSKAIVGWIGTPGNICLLYRRTIRQRTGNTK